MRLTLRNMLAQMDGLLEPEDAADIAKKIEESPFAKSLLQRIHDVTRRIRLAAPALNERGPNLDPNTVAEYLDHVLADDRVPDFENVCLKSDMHLAEVACCHQILALVLGQPAEVDPQSRKRMYQLPDVLAAREAAEGKVELPEELVRAAGVAKAKADGRAAVSPVGTHDEGIARGEPRPAGRRIRWISAVAVVVLGLALLAWAMGQFEPDGSIGRLVRNAPPSSLDSEPPKEPKSREVEPREQQANEKPTIVQPPSVAGEERVATPPDEPAPLPPTRNGVETAPTPPSGGQESPTNASNSPSPPEKPAGELPPTTDQLPQPSGNETVPPSQPRVEIIPPVARMVSDGQVLLRYVPEDDSWQRVAGKAVLTARQVVLALPAFRPELAMNSGITVRLLGPTRISLRAADSEGISGVDVDFGRLLLIPAAKPGAQIAVGLTGGISAGVLTFVHPESMAAIEVVPVRPPGTDPEQSTAQWAVTIYAGSGELRWDVADRPSVSISAGGKATLAAAGWIVAAAEMPRWISSEPLPLLEEQAARFIEQAMPADRPAIQSLLELSGHRRREVRWLAARSLALLGRVDLLCAALNDPEAKNEWFDATAKLIEAITIDPRIARSVRETLQRQYGQTQGADIYRVLWGYTEADFVGGEAARLISFLDSDLNALRVVSFFMLRETTGLTFSYRPDMPANQRKAVIQRWKEKLDAGEIRPSAPESKAPRVGPSSPARVPAEGGLPAPPSS